MGRVMVHEDKNYSTSRVLANFIRGVSLVILEKEAATSLMSWRSFYRTRRSGASTRKKEDESEAKWIERVVGCVEKQPLCASLPLTLLGFLFSILFSKVILPSPFTDEIALQLPRSLRRRRYCLHARCNSLSPPPHPREYLLLLVTMKNLSSKPEAMFLSFSLSSLTLSPPCSFGLLCSDFNGFINRPGPPLAGVVHH